MSELDPLRQNFLDPCMLQITPAGKELYIHNRSLIHPTQEAIERADGKMIFSNFVAILEKNKACYLM